MVRSNKNITSVAQIRVFSPRVVAGGGGGGGRGGIKNLYCCNSHLEHQGVYGTLWAETVPLSSEIF